MLQNEKSADKSDFTGFLLHTITTSDKVIRYGENNQAKNNEHPTIIQHGKERTINIYVTIPDIAEIGQAACITILFCTFEFYSTSLYTETKGRRCADERKEKPSISG